MKNKFQHSVSAVDESFVKGKGRLYGIEFPQDYAKFIAVYNGGSPELPCFFAKDWRGREKALRLHYVFGFTDEIVSESVTLMNDSFSDWGVRQAGYWVIGSVEEDVGHLLLDYKSNEVVLCNLNASYGIPKGGPSLKTGKTFGAFVESLSADPKGEWTPRKWA